jgi:hypothetical protein
MIFKAWAMTDERQQPETLDAYMGLGSEEIVRLVLWLLVEESLHNRLADFRQKLPAKPVEREEELVG